MRPASPLTATDKALAAPSPIRVVYEPGRSPSHGRSPGPHRRRPRPSKISAMVFTSSAPCSRWAATGRACDAYKGDLSNALFFNLEARAEVLSLLSTLKQLVATAKVCWTIEHDYLELESELSVGGINPIPGTLQESAHNPGKRHQPAGIQRASAAPGIRLARWPNGRNRGFPGRYRGSHDVPRRNGADSRR